MQYPRYISTRSSDRSFTLPEAIMHGLAPDGGLFVPSFIPEFDYMGLDANSYSETSASVLKPFFGGHFSDESLRSVCEDSCSFDVPLKRISGGAWNECYLLELFHGPTLSFKDFGARMLGRLLGIFGNSGSREAIAGISKSGKTVVLVATSGDTGSAVADGLSGIDGLELIILYPGGQVSDLQERQLIVKRDGVTACRVNGSFDDCQLLVKGAFSSPSLSSVRLTSANSINIGRLLPQMIYYVWAARQLPVPPVFCVPSGNLGNLTAGLIAWKAGMPAAGFVAANNANGFFADYLRGVQSSPRKSLRTISNAMDVGDPSNFERLSHLFPAEELRDNVFGCSVSDAETTSTIEAVYRETGYIADPHTAVALESARRYRVHSKFSGPIVVLSTAHPAKFPSAVKAIQIPARLDIVQTFATSVITLENRQEDLNSIILDRIQ